LLFPSFPVPTKEAYAGIKPEKPAVSVKEIIKTPIDKWKNVLVNDFEKTVFKEHPQLTLIKESFYQKGALYASMSGSGSAMFGIFQKEVVLENILKEGYQYWKGYI
jgi:4-diphosphocytidyl-2-C-methyl-D-erythritol kinase